MILISLAKAFVSWWQEFTVILMYGGWIFFSAFLLYAKFYLHGSAMNKKFLADVEWVYLNITIPDMPSESVMSAEQMFAQIHGTKKPIDWRQKNILGEQRLWFSFEIVSLGGAIRYIIRSPREDVSSVKAAVFSQYPNAEINEVGDYMEAFSLPFGPDSDYDIWGADLKLDKMEAYPIRTFDTFQDKGSDVIIDPLAGFLEAMTSIDPEEIMVLQILAQPADDDWKKAGYEEVKKLKGMKDKVAGSEEFTPPSMMLHLSESEKDTIKVVQEKLGKLSYKGKVRVLYAATKSSYKRKFRLSSIVGSLRQFADTNALKQNMYTETLVSTLISDKLEAKGNAETLLWKKKDFIRDFKIRDLWGGRRYHLSTKELATLFHLPLENVRTAAIEKNDSRKGEAPINLPV